MYKYRDGTPMQEGDQVLIENGATKGTIKQLVISAEEQTQWSVPTPGVLVAAPPYGNVFLPGFTMDTFPIELVTARSSH